MKWKTLHDIAVSPKNRKFHSSLVQSGDLVLDIGANTGSKTKLYLSMGAKVIAVEPHPKCAERLRKKYVGHPEVIIVEAAVAELQGTGMLYQSTMRSPLTSMSQDWIKAVRQSGRFSDYTWAEGIHVPVTTLDALIAQFGSPAFCKIDVEGYEAQVLKGLSQPIPKLSFEFHEELPEKTAQCVEYLEKLGNYRFNYTTGNYGFKFRFERNVTGRLLIADLGAGKGKRLHGDVYAFLGQTA